MSMWPDFNLLITLDVLLAEGSVARAARRLRLSPSAMSRALARLRETTGDPLLVRAGRGLVPTPRAGELREQVRQLVEGGAAVLRPVETIDLRKIKRTFTVRCRDGFGENFGPPLLDHIAREAPGVTLCFVPKTNKDSAPLRDGTVDFETGVVGSATSPELRVQALFKDRFIGVVRADHPLRGGGVTVQRFAQARHICVSRQGPVVGPIDEALAQMGWVRHVAVIVGDFSTALALARQTDLVASVPERHTGNLRAGMESFPLPVTTPAITLSLLWHPRMEADPAHRWMRGLIRTVCGGVSA